MPPKKKRAPIFYFCLSLVISPIGKTLEGFSDSEYELAKAKFLLRSMNYLENLDLKDQGRSREVLFDETIIDKKDFLGDSKAVGFEITRTSYYGKRNKRGGVEIIPNKYSEVSLNSHEAKGLSKLCRS